METSDLLARARAVSRLPATPRERRRIREDAGVTQRELAAALGVVVMTLNRWERGLATPQGRHAAAYAALLDQLAAATEEGFTEARVSTHPKGCVYGGFSCGYWLIAEGCEMFHPETHYVTNDRCPCGHEFPGAGTGVFVSDAEDKELPPELRAGVE